MHSVELKTYLKKNLVATVRHGYHMAIHISGAPGGGKSDIAEQAVDEVAEELGVDMGFHPFFLNSVDSIDVRGIGIPQKHRNERTGSEEIITAFSKSPLIPPDDAPEFGVVFLDEFAQASHDVQKPTAQFLLKREIGDYTLPKGWTVWAASNRAQDRSGVGRSLAFITNRVCMIDYKATLDGWLAWAEKAGINYKVQGFAKYTQGTVFANQVPADPGQPFCTPRSLVRCAEQLAVLSGDPINLATDTLALEVASGLVGPGSAAELFAFLRLFDELPQPDDIKNDPEGCIVPTKPDAMLAVSTMVANIVDKDNAQECFTYIKRMRREFQVATLQSCMRRVPQIVMDKKFGSWLSENVGLVTAANSV